MVHEVEEAPRPASVFAKLVERERTAFWLVRAALYVLAASLLWPSLSYAPVSLDDASMLRTMADQPLSVVWEFDRFGHLRPAKSLLFWLLEHDVAPIGFWRGVVLLTFVATMAAVQSLAARVAKSHWTGIAALACWALHPTTASVVCWLSAANIAFCLLFVLLYLRCGELALAAQGQALGERWYVALAMLALAAALLSHELALASPLLLLVLHRLVHRSERSRGLYVGSAAVACASLALSLWSSGGASAYRFETDTPAWLISLSSARYFGEHLSLWLWPLGSFGILLRDDPAHQILESSVWWLALLLAGYVAFCFRHRDRALTLGLFWAAVMLAPSSNFVPFGNTPLAMHYLYVPGVGLAIALSRAVFLVTAAVRHGPAGSRGLAFAVFMVVAALSVVESRRAVAAWSDDEQLYRATLENHPDNVEAWVNLSAVLLREERFDEASSALEAARALAPHDLNVIRNSLSLLAIKGQYVALLELLSLHPELRQQPEFSLRAGEALRLLERHREAATAYQQAFEAATPSGQPAEWCEAGYRLAIARLQTGATMEQVQTLVRRLLPHCPDPALVRLGELLRF